MKLVDITKIQAAYLSQVAVAQTFFGPAVAINTGSITQYA